MSEPAFRSLPAHAARIAAIVAALLAVAAPPAVGADAAPAAAPGDRLMVDAVEYPWSAIGRVNIGGRAFCTGFLVGEREVVTAGHCLYDFRSGRWWSPIEMHFVAAYQRDQHLIHSAVADYVVADDFHPSPRPRIEAAAADWAVVRLAEPIGRRAGFLALAGPDRAARNGQLLLQAGYRTDAAHAITVNLDCGLLGTAKGGGAVAHSCAVLNGDSGSPILQFADNEFRVVGVHVWRIEKASGPLGGIAVAAGALFDRQARPRAHAALGPAARSDRSARAPAPGGPARPIPDETITLLLGGPGGAASIESFQRAHGLAVTGRGSVELLGRILAAQRRGNGG
jgi:protease YdgD